MSAPRVRFAPSPTGYLHIGGVRAALYGWLWAKQKGGEFILRIEDTDQARNTEESVGIIFESLRWLGMDWDEGPEVGGPNAPYFQSQRLELYREYADKLIASGHAYRCYAGKEELAAARAEHKLRTGQDHGFRFQSPWRERTDGDATQKHVVRFKAPSKGVIAWDDLVKGRIEVDNATQQDFVLMRPNGLPLYSFGCVVDDLTMGVTLVTRGDDHMINTAPQILMYRALGAEPPQFAHMPMVLGPDGKKLSKRHAAVSVLEYRDMGYLPDAVLNYLVRLGWSHGDQEIFTRAELVELFNWEHVGSGSGRYDQKKFLHVSAEHLRALPHDELAKWVVPFLAERGIEVTPDDATLLAALPYLTPRASTLIELADAADYFLRDAPVFEDKARRKFLIPENAETLRELTRRIEGASEFTLEALEASVKAWLEEADLKMKQIAQPARVAMSGRTRSPGLYEVMVVLGRERTLERLKAGAALAESGVDLSA
ncbi:MAG: glutamate--tRNA ligase [Deltaproteobacteria bacterium]|nr:glutamate--tRNA ligase [Deltaproteobacteria bacterium]